MWNEGLAACSMLTCAGVVLFGPSAGDGETGGGSRALGSRRIGSSRSAKSVMTRPGDFACCGFNASGESFWTTAGRSSAVVAASSPNGPRGPSDSSRAWRVVDCVVIRRGPREAFDGPFRGVVFKTVFPTDAALSSAVPETINPYTSCFCERGTRTINSLGRLPLGVLGRQGC